jgi:hypothetical protein
VVNAILIAINALSPGVWWAQWPLIGWGIGLVGHGLAVFRPLRGWARIGKPGGIQAYMDKP